MAKRRTRKTLRLPKTHKRKGDVAILRYNSDDDEFWLDFSTISISPEASIAAAREAERTMPRFYGVHPAVGLYELDVTAKLIGEL